MTLKEYVATVRKLAKGKVDDHYIRRSGVKTYIEANWNKNIAPSYTVARIQAELGKK